MSEEKITGASLASMVDTIMTGSQRELAVAVETRYTASGRRLKPVTEQGIQALPEFYSWMQSRRKGSEHSPAKWL